VDFDKTLKESYEPVSLVVVLGSPLRNFQACCPLNVLLLSPTTMLRRIN